jgi:hypothetical protein
MKPAGKDKKTTQLKRGGALMVKHPHTKTKQNQANQPLSQNHH